MIIEIPDRIEFKILSSEENQEYSGFHFTEYLMFHFMDFHKRKTNSPELD